MIDARAYTQVSYIISLMSNSLKEKIPQNLINMIERDKDKNYEIKEVNVRDMILLNDTEKILSVIYTDYIANEEEQRIIKQKERLLRQKEEQEKRKEYNTELFEEKVVRTENNENLYMIQEVKEKWYHRLLNRIKVALGL